MSAEAAIQPQDVVSERQKWLTDVRHVALYWRKSNRRVGQIAAAVGLKELLQGRSVRIIDLMCGSGFSALQIYHSLAEFCGISIKSIRGVDLPENEGYFKQVLGREGHSVQFLAADLNTREGRADCAKFVAGRSGGDNELIININGITYLQPLAQKALLKIVSNGRGVLVTLLGEHSMMKATESMGIKGLVWDNIFGAMPAAGVHMIREKLFAQIEFLAQKSFEEITGRELRDIIVSPEAAELQFLEVLFTDSVYSFSELVQQYGIKKAVYITLKGFLPIMQTYMTMGKVGSEGHFLSLKDVVTMLDDLGTAQNCFYVDMENDVGFFGFGFGKSNIDEIRKKL